MPQYLSVDDIITKRLDEPLLAYREKKRKREDLNEGDQGASGESEDEDEDEGCRPGCRQWGRGRG